MILFEELLIHDPTNWLVRDAKRGEDIVVEIIGAQENFMNAAKEVTRLCALNDAVVIGAGERDDLADCEIGQRLFVRALEFCWVIHRANAEDEALTLNQSRNGVNGPESARVGE